MSAKANLNHSSNHEVLSFPCCNLCIVRSKSNMMIWILLFALPLTIEGKHDCPGKNFSCPDSSTCCQTLDQSYGCCPLENAVCCDDHIHCCPSGHKCSAGLCVLSTNSTTEPTLVVNKDVTCPDSQKNVTCPDLTTCCLNPDTGNYDCCPMENAVCCNDGYHCCPTGTTCNIREQRCDGDGYIAKLYRSHAKYAKHGIASSAKKMSILRVSDKLKNVICPGSGFQCPDYSTCCKLPSGNWGCCPFPNGFCCQDGIHCCPENMHCDATSQYCSQDWNGRNITSLRSKPAKKLELNPCPDKKTCQDFETCCKISDSSYGCCPYQNATCCQDRKHCCPGDSQCDETGGRCIPKKNNFVLKVLNKFGF
ncbi:hypothetical protein JTE90_019577 [Oedothorax gibbosus]|uniref:Granulins domain-containing protein n=1 Tax=Oedothorax gibbosus TaxID=931172 RepID=A0AAV6V615_9ARAC|nr:hypothetical protein JTE90_019577 [Oedothorax gibbosus]